MAKAKTIKVRILRGVLYQGVVLPPGDEEEIPRSIALQWIAGHAAERIGPKERPADTTPEAAVAADGETATPPRPRGRARRE
jgi:hypothetical protein